MPTRPTPTTCTKRFLMSVTLGVLTLSCFALPSLAIDLWQRDFDAQRPSQKPQLEARYASAERDGFLIEAERYTVQLDLKAASRHAVSQINVMGEAVLHSGVLEIQDNDGIVWDTSNARTPSRINLYRRGPYYDEVHWLDLSFTRGDEVFPVRGEVVFYSYAESCRVGVVLHATESVEIKQVALRLELGDSSSKVDIPIAHEPGECLAVAGKGQRPVAWFSTTAPRASLACDDGTLRIQWFKDLDRTPVSELIPGNPKEFGVGFVALPNAHDWKDLRAELEPLGGGQLELMEGTRFAHDGRRGDYVVSTHNPGGFSYHYYENRNDYRRARIRVRNGEVPRKIYLRHEVGSGSKGQVECGVILDEHEELLPLLVQISKNFAGEKEEKFYNPRDTPFSETFVPLYLDAEEVCELVSVQLYQDWGNHPLKQFSSLGAWMDYFHMSTGVTETTCYVPFQFYTGISIADLRGMSGVMWKSQPQHDNVGGHIFSEYVAADRPGERQVIEYLGTSYHSTGPNWAHITFDYLSSDSRLRTTLETFEYAQLDELRNFIRLRLTALADIPIRDWAKDFRFMQIDTRTQRLRYQNVTYVDTRGETVTKPIAFDDSWTLCGEPMTRSAPVAAVWNSPKGNNAFVVEDWRGSIGGKPLRGMAVSCEGRTSGDSNLVLVPQSGAAGLRKGDTIEVDLFIMPYGKAGDDYSAALRERERYGLKPIRITDVQSGEVLSHFPPRIRASDENLRFTLQGGFATACVSIEGLHTYSGWSLEGRQDGQWERIAHGGPMPNSGIGGEGQQRTVCDDGTFGVALRVRLDGEAHEFRLSRE